MEWGWLDAGKIRAKLARLDCILCLETAADYLGLSNGGMTNKISVYSVAKIEVDGIECIIVPNYEGIKHEASLDIQCTTVEQTLVDILKYDRDSQAIMESLSNYYFEHGESFDELISTLPSEIITTFERYRVDSVEYYNE